MKVLKGHRFRLDLDAAQESLCSRTAGICRCLWNLALEQRSMAWSGGRRSVSYNAQAAELAELKQAFAWVAEAPHHCLQQTLRDLDRAFRNFFSGKSAYPRFRKKYRRDSFRFPDPKQFAVDESGRRMRLPKLGWITYRNGRGPHALRLEGKPKSITASREGKHWFASVLCEIEMEEPKPIDGPDVGIDVGVAQSVTTSSGEVLTILGMTKAERRKLASLQRELSRKRKGSRNWLKACQQLAEFTARVARRRRDGIHKATTYLSKNHGRVVAEDLRVVNMTATAKGTVEKPGRNVRAKAGLNRAILDVGFGEIRRQLEYKCRWYGSELVLVGPAYTSQRCSMCGHTEAANRRTQAQFCCLRCGHRQNADHNAARNILKAGVGLPAVGQTVEACGGKA